MRNIGLDSFIGDLSSTSGSMHQQRTSGQAVKEEREKKKMEGREGKEKGKVRRKDECKDSRRKSPERKWERTRRKGEERERE